MATSKKKTTLSAEEKKAAALRESEIKVRQMQTQKAHATRLKRAMQRDPVVRAVVAERDALREKVAKLEKQLAAKSEA